MTTKRMNTNDRIDFARMYWHRVWHEGYGHDSARAFLKGYGLSEAQIESISHLAESKADQWSAAKRSAERAG